VSLRRPAQWERAVAARGNPNWRPATPARFQWVWETNRAELSTSWCSPSRKLSRKAFAWCGARCIGSRRAAMSAGCPCSRDHAPHHTTVMLGRPAAAGRVPPAMPSQAASDHAPEAVRKCLPEEIGEFVHPILSTAGYLLDAGDSACARTVGPPNSRRGPSRWRAILRCGRRPPMERQGVTAPDRTREPAAPTRPGGVFDPPFPRPAHPASWACARPSRESLAGPVHRLRYRGEVVHERCRDSEICPCHKDEATLPSGSKHWTKRVSTTSCCGMPRAGRQAPPLASLQRVPSQVTDCLRGGLSTERVRRRFEAPTGGWNLKIK